MQWYIWLCVSRYVNLWHYYLNEILHCIKRIPCYNPIGLLMKIQRLTTFLQSPSSFSLVRRSLGGQSENQWQINSLLCPGEVRGHTWLIWIDSQSTGRPDHLYGGLNGSLNTSKARMSNRYKHAVCCCEYISGVLWVVKNIFSIH